MTNLKYIFFFLFVSCTSEKTFKVHSAWPVDNFHTLGLKEFADLVSKKTKGKLILKIFPDGELGFKDDHILEHVQNGNVEVADALMGNLSKKSEIFGLSSIPRMAGSFAHAWSLYQANKKFYKEELKKFGAILLYVVPWPPSGIFSKIKIKNPEDFKKLKMRTYDENSAEFVKHLGAFGIQIPFSELNSALNAEMIDSILTSTTTGKDIEVWKVMKFYHEINYAFPLNMVIMNEAVFDSLNQDGKKAILEASHEVEMTQWKLSQKSHEEGLATMREKGVEIVSEFPKIALEALDKASIKIRDAWILKVKKDSFSLDMYRESD